MKRFNLVVFCVLMGFLAFGCGKKSGLEGKVVDGKGKPMANVKIIAKQVQPIKGYEQFEATTDSDGTFSFGKLFPTSEYILFPWFDDWSSAPQRSLKYEANKLTACFNKEGWTTEAKMKAQSGPEGQTTLLTSSIVIQPYISKIEGKVVDGKKRSLKGIKIIAKQVKPVPGYEQFEATTGSDGTFRFGKLFPTSEYVLFLLYKDWTEAPMRTLQYEANKLVVRFNKDGWTTGEKMEVQSGPEGQTTLLTTPIVIQPCISSIEGKVMNGKGKPVVNLKIVAKQKHPVPGYEQLEAVTGSDGAFIFKRLFPRSEYVLFPRFDDWPLAPQRTLKYEANKLTARFNKEGWTTRDKMKVQSGPEEQTIMLASPMVIHPCISTVTGKLVDGRKRPMQGIEIMAKQVNPVPGYEQFEATTDADGSFSFTKLYPDSEYRFFPVWNFKTDRTWTVRTSGEEERLHAAPSFRFIMANGVVSDFRTGLQWAAKDNGRDINWQNARAYCQNYSGGGHTDWRLPTVSELKGLHKAGIRPESDGIIIITDYYLWSSETRGSGAAVLVFDSSGYRSRYTQKRSDDFRALPVRACK